MCRSRTTQGRDDNRMSAGQVHSRANYWDPSYCLAQSPKYLSVLPFLCFIKETFQMWTVIISQGSQTEISEHKFQI